MSSPEAEEASSGQANPDFVFTNEVDGSKTGFFSLPGQNFIKLFFVRNLQIFVIIWGLYHKTYYGFRNIRFP
jgi:hypothetical protein